MIRSIKSLTLTLILTGSVVFSAFCQNTEEIFQQGNLFDKEGDYRKALIYVDSSMTMDSSLYQRFGFRAEIKFKLGMVKEAIDDISKCIDKCRCPTRKYHVSDYYRRRAEMKLSIFKIPFAIEDANKSISRNPSNWKAYNVRSNLMQIQGLNLLALADLDKSFVINDNEATTLKARGKLRFEIGDLEGACADFSIVAKWGFDEYDSWVKRYCKN